MAELENSAGPLTEDRADEIAGPMPDDWPAIDTFERLCGVRLNSDRSTYERLSRWYGAFRRPPRLRLPLVAPYFADLGALLVHEQPPLRNLPMPLTDYVERHLRPLSAQPAVRMVRRRLTQDRVAPHVEAVVASRFIRQVMSWLHRFWRQNPAYRWMTTSPRAEWLHREDACEAFLAQIPLLLAHESSVVLQSVIPPLERFRLGAMARDERESRVAWTSAEPNAELIAACANSPDLEPVFGQPPPMIARTSDWRDLNNFSGERVALRQVRKTTEIRRLNDVVPQELTLLAADPTGAGASHFLHKLTNEGVLIWDRQHYSRPTTWNRVLVCCVALVGNLTNIADSAFYLPRRRVAAADATTPSDSFDTRARCLVFDILRDLGMSLTGTPLQVDFRGLLYDARRDHGQAWQMTREDLESGRSDERCDLMLDLESHAPGYFLEGTRSVDGGTFRPRDYLERAYYAEPYDGRVFVMVGTPEHVGEMLPEGIGRRARGAGFDAVFVVRQTEVADPLAVAIATSFDDRDLRWRFVPTEREDFRHHVRQAVFGEPLHARRQGAEAR